MKLIVALLLLTQHDAGIAQTWLVEPIVRVCEKVITCNDEKDIDLTDTENEYISALISGLPAKASEATANRFFGRPPFKRTDPISTEFGNKSGIAIRSTWLLDASATNTLSPHVDVYFFNGQVYVVQWWSKTMMLMVNITYAR